MQITVTVSHFETIIKKGYSLDMVYLLTLCDQDLEISALVSGSARIKAIKKALVVKGFLTEENKITTTGRELLSFMESTKAELVLTKPSDDGFNKWWNTFPGTDTFRYQGVTFTGSRSLRVSKEECRLKFNAIILEGEYTPEQMVAALQIDIEQKKNASIKTKTNKLTYLQNSATYLRQRSYEPYIELIGTKMEKEYNAAITGIDI